MIKKIYYWDGILTNEHNKLNPNIPQIPNYNMAGFMEDGSVLTTVDAMDGWKSNDADLEYYGSHQAPFTIVTNQPSALCFEWFDLSNPLDTQDKVYLYSKSKHEWLPVECFTTKELRRAHNLEKMYKAGVFEEDDE